MEIEVCVSDNGSTDRTESVVLEHANSMALKYVKNEENVGVAKNILRAVDLSEGEFVWLVGDDDVLLIDSLARLDKLMQRNPDVDFYYGNAFIIQLSHVDSFGGRFDTMRLERQAQRFSSYRTDGPVKFFDLINPEVSFDFLAGMFLSIFRRSIWQSGVESISESSLDASGSFSTVDNTFPHIRVFANAFSGRPAYFNSSPLIGCINGVREWAPLFPLVRSFRLPEAVEMYRKAGLPFFQYVGCRNFSLSHFLPDVTRMLISPRAAGLRYAGWNFDLSKNLVFPNFYLSPLIDWLRRMREKERSSQW